MKRDYCILGIGMSAGGLQSVSEFFNTFNVKVGVSIVIATHLQENFQSKLLEILNHKSVMKVKVLEADIEMVEGMIYVVSPGMEASLENNLLKVQPIMRDNRMIDTLFSSMAINGSGPVIGMILSGTGTDGAEGLKAISEAGGHVLVQEPFSALYQSLPRLAIKTDHPDKILPPVRLAAWLNKYLCTKEIGNNLRHSSYN